MNGECYFARAGDDCYTCWKAGSWNRACLLSNVNLPVPKFKRGSGILTFSPWYICQALYHPDPTEDLLSNVNLCVPKFKQGSGILISSPWSICQALYHPHPTEDLLCVLCATCTVSHLSPLTNDREQLRLKFFSRRLQYSAWVFTWQRPLGDDVEISQLEVCPFCPTVQT